MLTTLFGSLVCYNKLVILIYIIFLNENKKISSQSSKLNILIIITTMNSIFYNKTLTSIN